MNINDAMSYINGFSKLGSPVTDLSRFRRIMDALGNPQDKLKFVHIAGTNGKGSTVRMIADSLTSAGYRTGEFTSPYITVYNDRIRIDGKNISDDELCGIILRIRPVMDSLCEECSQFEISSAIAFTYYAEMKCDIVVLEAGLGGLLDCTNIITTTAVSVITHIALDHTKILGDTYEKIARQKAGIIKLSRPVVLAPSQPREAENIVRGTAVSLGSEFITPDIDKLKVEECGCGGNIFKYKGESYKTLMLGRHQIDNALTAIETLNVLKKQGFKISYTDIFNGTALAEVPSRCQVLRNESPFVIIDGAHNPDGMKALSEFVAEISKSPKIMICGMMETKDWHTALQFISPYIDTALCVDGFTVNTVSAPKLLNEFRSAQTINLDEAVKTALRLAGNDGMVIIAGSLYLAAALRKMMSVEDGSIKL